MKILLLNLFIIISLFVISCNSSTNVNDSHDALHQHNEHNENLHADNHSANDGHNHEAEALEETHSNEIIFTEVQAKAVELETEVVKPKSFSSVIKTSGQIQSSQGDEQTIVATSAGTISFANSSIADGTPVRAGDPIVTISAKNLQDGDPVLKAKNLFETAEKEYKRAKSLVADKIISVKQFEQTKLAYENAKNAYLAQSKNITSLGIRVTSPISGYIKNRFVNQGEYVSVGQPIATVTKSKRLQLRAEVSENYFKQLRNIKTANFKTVYDNSLYCLSDLNGKLLSYGKTSNSNSFFIPITFEFDNIGDIIPGSFAEIYLLSAPRDGVIAVPVSAITEEQGLNYVYLQVEPEAFIKREVKIGQSDGKCVEIIEGLNEGDVVVTNGAIQIKLASVSSAIPSGHNH